MSKLRERGLINEDLYNLVLSPSRLVRRYNGYDVNGFKFKTLRFSNENNPSQNYGVMVKGDDSSNKEYYGVLE